MSVKLKVLDGAIKKHGKWQLTVPIRKSPFVIGQAADCNMRCYGQAIGDYHCEIRVDGFDVFVRELQSQSETFINGNRLAGERRCIAGDQLRFGRLAFELLIQRSVQAPPTESFDEFISDMLLEADEADRRERARSPEARWFQIEAAPPRDPYEGLTPKERLIAKARKKLPPKQDQPMKLPKRCYVADSANQAVTECLANHYQGLNVNSVGWYVSET